MDLEGERPQMFRQLELPFESRGEAPRVERSEEEPPAVRGDERSGASDLMAKVVNRQNLQAALKRVRKNKGSPGIDGMTVDLRFRAIGKNKSFLKTGSHYFR
ncbi:MAG: hypothetical protein OEV87_12905 [Phycisphaerae bacterium]|nr:hypothetical protein [Phycisphaerae bacterium]